MSVSPDSLASIKKVSELHSSAVQHKAKLVYIEVLRILAAYLVIFNHTRMKGFLLFSERTDSPFYFFYMFLSILDKVAVPLFFMISGALLLKKDETVVECFKKRVLHFILVIIAVSLPYHLWLDFYRQGRALSEFRLSEFLLTVYSRDASFHLWYLYQYLGILLMLPFLRRLARGMTKQEYLYLMCSHVFLMGFLPAAEFVLGHGAYSYNPSFSVPLILSSCIFYPLVGHFFEYVLDKKYYCARYVIMAFLAGGLVIGLACSLTQLQINVLALDGEPTQTFHSSLIAIPAMSAFFAFKVLFTQVTFSEKTQRILSQIGKTTFGVYLFHYPVQEATEGICDLLTPIVGALPACLIWTAIVFTICSVFTAILKKLPLTCKLL